MKKLLSQIDKKRVPKHVAIIMDGNGRWAKKHALNRVKGHKKGADAVRATVEIARKIGISFLTLYAFSTENWSRPKKEINALMRLLVNFLKSELTTMQKNEIKLLTIGYTEKLPNNAKKILTDVIQKTSLNQKMSLILALNYGARDEIVRAVKSIVKTYNGKVIIEKDISDNLFTKDIPDPDLIIRTSGEKRVSNFLLWQAAYSEFYFTQTLWPDFGKEDFLAAILDFQSRVRRFGGIK